MNWIELAVPAHREAVDAVAEVFRTHGHGVAIEEPFIQPRLDEPPRPHPGGCPLVKTYLPDDENAAGVQRTIEEALWHLGQLGPVESLRVRRVAEEDWANAWKSFFPVVRIGSRTVVVPAWRRRRRRPGEIQVRLDPGLAFGTGMHPTTRLCLLAAETLVPVGGRVLDVGTGSGILAIASALLGAKEVFALDIDPVAVAAARSNVRLNRLSRAVRVFQASPDALPDGSPSLGQFDVVFANITAKVNASLAGLFPTLLRPNGRLVGSGILEENLEAVAQGWARAGLQVLETQREEDWVAITAAIHK